MINHKLRVFENHILSNTEDEKIYEEFQKVFHKYSLMDEKDSYIKYPLEVFKSKEFKDQFNIRVDDYTENNLLQDIPHLTE